MVHTRQKLENTRRWHTIIIDEFLQTGFEYTNSLHNLHKSHHFQLYNREAQFKQKRTYTTLVLSLYTTGQTGLHGDSHVDTGQTGPPDRSGSQQNPAHGWSTRQPSSLGVSLHHLPPLCIPADELDTAGEEVDVWVPWNTFLGGNNPEQLILRKTYPTSGYT